MNSLDLSISGESILSQLTANTTLLDSTKWDGEM
jgi:hypothetical protein